MKAALIALALTVLAPVHVTATAPVSFPAGWLILAAEVLAVAGPLAVRAVRRFRSAPWPRSIRPAGVMS